MSLSGKKLEERLWAAFVICLFVLAGVLTILSVPSLIVIRQTLTQAEAEEPVRIIQVELEEIPQFPSIPTFVLGYEPVSGQITGYSIRSREYMKACFNWIQDVQKSLPIEIAASFNFTPGTGYFYDAVWPENIEIHTGNVEKIRLIIRTQPMGNTDYLWLPETWHNRYIPQADYPPIRYLPTHVTLETPDEIGRLMFFH